jgi:hypothetical protein
MSKILQTDSVTELARFWDSHDLTEFEDELEEIRETVFDPGGQNVLHVRLRPEQAATLRRIAQAKGIDETDLVRDWVDEKLRTS